MKPVAIDGFIVAIIVLAVIVAGGAIWSRLSPGGRRKTGR